MGRRLCGPLRFWSASSRDRTLSSRALQQWEKTAGTALNEIEVAHRAIVGRGRGRQFATLQVNHAYAVLLSSQFQAFSRSLHSEAVDFLATAPAEAWPGGMLRVLMTRGRKLDYGNPNPGNLGADFSRIGMPFWEHIRRGDKRAEAGQRRLEELNDWRNAIAHQDWDKVGGNPSLRIATVRRWRSTCSALARTFDRAVHAYLLSVVGRTPW